MPSSMPDLQHLVSLERLFLTGNGSSPTGTLDVSKLANLTVLKADWTLLEEIKLDNLASLLLVNNPKLTVPDLSNTTITNL